MNESLPKPFSPFVLDVNGDAAFTISDLRLWFAELFFLPGDWLIWLLLARLPGVAAFLEIDSAAYGGLLSGVISGCAWFVLFIGSIVVYAWLRRIDEALTSRLRRGYEFALRRARLSVQLVKNRRCRTRSAPASQGVDLVAEIELDETELAALAAHAEIRPPYALSLGEAAAALGLGRHQTHKILDKLAELKLLDRATGSAYGETAYLLSRAGRGYLLFKQLGPRGS